MRISEIKFRMNVEVAAFKHEHVEVTVAVDAKDEQAEKVLASARKAGLRK